MRVAFSDAYPHAFYGAQRMLLALMRALPGHGIAPVLLVHGDGPLARNAAAAGIEVRAASPPAGLRDRIIDRSRVLAGPAMLRYGLRLRPLLRDCRLVVGNQIRSVLTLAPAAAALRVPLVWYLRRPFRSGLGDLIALASVSGIISVSDAARGAFTGWARAWCDRKAETIPDGLDLQQWRPRDRAEARAALGLPAGAPIVACVGTVTPNKGQDVLVEAAALLRVRIPGLQVLIVGDAVSPQDRAYLGALRRRAEGIRFLGYRDDVAAIIAASDVVALPSREEGLPGVLLEAMSLRRPVVATATGGAGAVLRGAGGTLVPIGDAAALAQAMTRYLTDPALAARIGEEGRARVEAAFSLDRCAERVAAFLRRLAG